MLRILCRASRRYLLIWSYCAQIPTALSGLMRTLSILQLTARTIVVPLFTESQCGDEKGGHKDGLKPCEDLTRSSTQPICPTRPTNSIAVGLWAALPELADVENAHEACGDCEGETPWRLARLESGRDERVPATARAEADEALWRPLARVVGRRLTRPTAEIRERKAWVSDDRRERWVVSQRLSRASRTASLV